MCVHISLYVQTHTHRDRQTVRQSQRADTCAFKSETFPRVTGMSASDS